MMEHDAPVPSLECSPDLDDPIVVETSAEAPRWGKGATASVKVPRQQHDAASEACSSPPSAETPAVYSDAASERPAIEVTVESVPKAGAWTDEAKLGSWEEMLSCGLMSLRRMCSTGSRIDDTIDEVGSPLAVFFTGC